MANTPKYSSIIDEFLDEREPDWKDLGLKDAKSSGDTWLGMTHDEADEGFLDALAEGISKHTNLPAKAGTLARRMMEKDDAAPRLGVARGASAHVAGHDATSDDESLVAEVTETLEEAAKGGKVEKKHRTDGQIKTYINQLLNQGEAPSKVASKLKGLAKAEGFDLKMASKHLTQMAGLLGTAYLIPSKVAEIELFDKSKNMGNAYINNSNAGGTGMAVLEPNTFMDKENPSYNHTAGSKTAEPFQSASDVLELNRLRSMPGILGQISVGDRVTIRTPQGQERSGRAVMFNAKQQCWVLNMGGQHGTPGIADEENIIRVKKAPRTATVKTVKKATKIETRTNADHPDPLPQILEKLNIIFHDEKAKNPEGFLDAFEQRLGIHMMEVAAQLGLEAKEESGDKWVFSDQAGQMFANLPEDEDSTRVASSRDCVRQSNAWKAAGIQPRAKSVKQITACSDCSYFKKNGSDKTCGLYGLPVVGNAAELSKVVNRMTAGVPAESKKAALVQIANYIPNQVQQAKSSVNSPMVHQASFTHERSKEVSEVQYFSGAQVQKLHAAGHSLKTIVAAAEKKFGTLETSKAVREFVASLQKEKGKIIVAKADADYLKKAGIHNEAIVGASKCASCKAHTNRVQHKAASVDGVTRVADTFVSSTPDRVRAAQKTVVAKFDSGSVATLHGQGHSLDKIYKAASSKVGSVQASKAVREWAQGLKNTNTKIALSQIDCSVLEKMGVKLSAKNAIVGAEKCGSCSFRNGMHCGLTGGTLLTFPGMNRVASNKKVASGAPEDGRSMLQEFDLMGTSNPGDIDMTPFDFAEVHISSKPDAGDL